MRARSRSVTPRSSESAPILRRSWSTRFERARGSACCWGRCCRSWPGSSSAILSNRLRGPYFALSTIAFSQVLLIVASRWRGFTAGAEGIPVPFRPGFATLGLGHVAWVYMALGVAVLYYVVQVYLERSRIGLPTGRRAGGRGRGRGPRHPARRLRVFAVTERGPHLGVGHPVGPVRRLRRSRPTCSRSISPCVSRSTPSSAAWARRSVPTSARSSSPRGDVPARHLLRRQDRLRRHLSDRLRDHPHPGGPLRSRGPGGNFASLGASAGAGALGARYGARSHDAAPGGGDQALRRPHRRARGELEVRRATCSGSSDPTAPARRRSST